MNKITLEEVYEKLEDVLDRQDTIENLLTRLLRALNDKHTPDK